MSDETELLWSYHLGRYFNGPPEQREEAFGFLMAQGAAIVPWLMGELLKKREGDQKAGRPGRDTLHLAALLAELGDPRSLPLLFEVGDAALLGQLLVTLEQRATLDDIKALLVLMQRARPRWTGTALLVEFLPRETVLIATSLVGIAEQKPVPELRAALPLLKPHPLLPWELIGLHKRLKAALASHELPLPATAPQTRENLPIPIEERPTP